MAVFAIGQPVFLAGRAMSVVGVSDAWLELDTFMGSRRSAAPSEVSLAKGWTPLHTAAMSCRRGLFEDHASEDPNAPLGESVVLAQVRDGKVIASLDLAAGATPVHVAAYRGHRDLKHLVPDGLAALLEMGGDLRSADANGVTPLHVLGACDRFAVAWLAERESDLGVLAMEALKRKNEAALMGLARGGFDFDAPLDGGASLRERLVENKERLELQSRFKVSKTLALASASRRPHVIEPSRSSKTRCRACRKKIRKGEAAFGLGELDWFGVKREWFHVECARTSHPEELASARE